MSHYMPLLYNNPKMLVFLEIALAKIGDQWLSWTMASGWRGASEHGITWNHKSVFHHKNSNSNGTVVWKNFVIFLSFNCWLCTAFWDRMMYCGFVPYFATLSSYCTSFCIHLQRSPADCYMKIHGDELTGTPKGSWTWHVDRFPWWSMGPSDPWRKEISCQTLQDWKVELQQHLRDLEKVWLQFELRVATDGFVADLTRRYSNESLAKSPETFSTSLHLEMFFHIFVHVFWVGGWCVFP